MTDELKNINDKNNKNWCKPEVIVIVPKTKVNAIIKRYIHVFV